MRKNPKKHLKSAFNRLFSRQNNRRQRLQPAVRDAVSYSNLEPRQMLVGDFFSVSTFGAATSNFSDGRSIQTDFAGNVYSTGVFSGTIDFDPGAGVVQLTAQYANDVFLMKTSPAGELLWAKNFGGPGFDSSSQVSVDRLGNVYLTGYFENTVDFDPNSGVVALTSLEREDAFIAKFSTTGNLLWARSIGGENSQDANAVSIDGFGNVFVIGKFTGITDFDPSIFPVTPGNWDAFVMKLTGAGNFVWAKKFGAVEAIVSANDVAIDASNNPVIVGSFLGTIDFDPGAGALNLSSGAESKSFAMKLNGNGELIWARSTESPAANDTHFGNNVAIDGNGNVLVSGEFSGNADFISGTGTNILTSSGSMDAYVWKLSGTGGFIWAKRMGGTDLDFSTALGIDSQGSVYVGGAFSGTADFNPGPAVSNLVSAGNLDCFITKLDSAGNYVWARQLGGNQGDLILDITLDHYNYISTIGNFSGTCDFDPRAGVVNRTSSGGRDIFVSKLTQDIVYKSDATTTRRVSLRRNGANLEVVNDNNNSVLVSRPLAHAMGAQIGGVSVQDDQLTVNYRTGGTFSLPSGVRFNGGSAGNDKIIVVANSTEDVTYYPYSLTGRGEYSVTAGGVVLGSIYYSNIESATATDLRSLKFVTSGSQDILTAAPTTDFAGRVATRLFGTSGTTTIVPFTFTNIPNVTLDLGWADSPGSAGDWLNIQLNGLRAVGLQNFTVTTGIENDLVSTQNPLLSLPVAGGEFLFKGGAGTDELAASGDTNFRLNNARLQSDAGGRILFTELETASLSGGPGNNELTAVGFLGTVTLDGGAGNDTLRGTVNGDSLIGGLGNDQLFGQGGNDFLNGGSGSDVFNLDGTNEKDDLRLIRSTATIGRLELRAVGSPTLLKQSLFTYDNSDRVMIRALGNDDKITVDLAFAILGTVDGGDGADTCTAPTSWTKINM